ncbi:MAG: Thymidylate kinase [Thelocarpon impressellum]|nr:MAG: Thymidylate kinase [Thelocarpon impressellum]
MIDQYLKGEAQQEDHVIHLLFSANRWEAAAQIKADIAAGLTVVIDRYYYSGCVYSAAKDVPGLDLRWARWPEVGLPRPDLCLFLDISADAAARRSGFGGERYENVSMQARVRELFQELRGTYDEDFHVIDAGQDSEAVEKEVLDAVLRTMDLVAQNGTGKHLRQVRP